MVLKMKQKKMVEEEEDIVEWISFACGGKLFLDAVYPLNPSHIVLRNTSRSAVL